MSDTVARFSPRPMPTGIRNNDGPLSKNALFMAAMTLIRPNIHHP